jgi:hypothetical protein
MPALKWLEEDNIWDYQVTTRLLIPVKELGTSP